MRDTFTRFAANTADTVEQYSLKWAYSRMKFGDQNSANIIARPMADALWKKHGAEFKRGTVLASPSPYNYVPNAASMLGRAVIERLNLRLAMENCAPIGWALVHRTLPYTADYGTLSSEDRKHLLNQDAFILNKCLIDAKPEHTLLFIDDVIVTGAHEDKMICALDDANIHNSVIFAYALQLSGEVPEMENALNFCGVHRSDIINIVSAYGWIVGSLKYVLNSSPDQARNFLEYLPSQRLEQFRLLSAAEGYFAHVQYRPILDIATELATTVNYNDARP